MKHTGDGEEGKKETRVFVYGTLKRDQDGRHHPLLRACSYKGTGSIRAKLYDLGSYPGAVPDGKAVLEGEIYQVPKEKEDWILKSLDKYEGGEYERHTVETTEGKAQCYLLARRPEEKARIPKWPAPRHHGA